MKSISKDLPEVFFPLVDKSTKIFLVSPFLSLNIANKLLDRITNKNVKLLTRFNLTDFYNGASDLTAIEKLYEAGVKIKGISKLHAKTYIFDSKKIISTSANLTNGGFYGNLEHGILYNNPDAVATTLAHFQELWNHGNLYSTKKANDWRKELSQASSNPKEHPPLGDYGGVFKSEIVDHQTFVKWLGTGHDRASLQTEIFDIIEDSGCNYAVCFSHHPKRYNDHDQIFISMMTDTLDYAIYGRAKAYAHDPARDIASDNERTEIGWKKDWPYYIRIHDIEFLQGNLINCPMLYRDVVNKLDYDSFQSTQKRHLEGESEINTKRSLRQKQDVRLTPLGALLLNKVFEKSIKKIGLIDKKRIDRLYNGNTAIGL